MLWVGNTHAVSNFNMSMKRGKNVVVFSGTNHKLLRKFQNYTCYRQPEHTKQSNIGSIQLAMA